MGACARAIRIWTMSDGDGNNANYEHIKALVRDIHVTKNVARPDQFAAARPRTQCVTSSEPVGVVHRQFLDVDHLRSPTTQRSLSLAVITTTNANYGAAAFSAHPDRAPIDDATDTLAMHASHLDESNLNVPSVIITDATEPLDLFHSTQRRFSQLYSGLRRLSTSHTVRNYDRSSSEMRKGIDSCKNAHGHMRPAARMPLARAASRVSVCVLCTVHVNACACVYVHCSVWCISCEYYKYKLAARARKLNKTNKQNATKPLAR